MEKKTLSTALGFEPRSFDYRSTALTTELHIESVFFSTERLSNSLNIWIQLHYLRYKSLKLSTRTPVDNVSYLKRDWWTSDNVGSDKNFKLA